MALAQAEADYQQSLADLENARADLQNAQATSRNVVQNARVAQSNAQVQAIPHATKPNRICNADQNLYKEQSLTKKQLEDSQNNVEVQSGLYNPNIEQVNLAKTSETVAQAGIAKAQANIQKIQAVLKVKQAAIDNAKLKVG
ncbi:hypothetical protein [Spirosoma foliorum]|uniref:hypothetical protein n=1 Tax=Spirosoma foliorum TaxID=2710596 RepID=UPI001F0A191B|nr:hypothetical protein [Spirosoma foliorum]